MAEWIEVTAPSVDAAKERALDLLGITIDEIEIEIVNEESSQLFGLRRTDARIRARVLPRTPPPKDDGRRRRPGREGRRGRDGRPRRGRSGGDEAKGASEPAGSRRRDGERAARGGRQQEGAAGAGGQRGSESARRRSRRPGGRRRGGATSDGDADRDGRRGQRDRPRSADAGSGDGERSARRTAEQDRAMPTRRRRPDGVVQITRRAGSPESPNAGADGQEAEMDSDVTTYEEQAETVGEFLDGVLESFGLEGRVVVGSVEDEDVEIDVEGDDLGLLIGPRGQTMTALHELAKTVLQRTAPSGPRVRIRLDVAGYRQKRREALSQFVRTQAAEVLASGEARALEPMNAADRKVVHDTINEIDGIVTESEGEEPRRRVVLVPS